MRQARTEAVPPTSQRLAVSFASTKRGGLTWSTVFYAERPVLVKSNADSERSDQGFWRRCELLISLFCPAKKNSLNRDSSTKKANERCNVGVAALIHFRGHCPHPSNHLRRRIHQPSLLPHNIHRNAYAAQESSFSCFETRAKS